jgi:ABC-type Na+ efflux pump permease subunit
MRAVYIKHLKEARKMPRRPASRPHHPVGRWLPVSFAAILAVLAASAVATSHTLWTAEASGAQVSIIQQP